jgi:hypothetical protein
MAAALYCAYKKRRATRGAASGLCLKKLADGLWQHRSRLPAFEPLTRMSAQLLPNRSRAMRHSGAIQRKPIPRLYGHISEYSTLGRLPRAIDETPSREPPSTRKGVPSMDGHESLSHKK